MSYDFLLIFFLKENYLLLFMVTSPDAMWCTHKLFHLRKQSDHFSDLILKISFRFFSLTQLYICVFLKITFAFYFGGWITLFFASNIQDWLDRLSEIDGPFWQGLCKYFLWNWNLAQFKYNISSKCCSNQIWFNLKSEKLLKKSESKSITMQIEDLKTK